MTTPSKWELLLEQYKLRVAWATSHYDRIMLRLQLFLTLETAAAAAGILSSNGKITPAAPWIAGLETLLSAAWLFVGRADRRMLRIYNRQLKDNWECLATLAGGSSDTPLGSVAVADAALGKPRLCGSIVEQRSVQDVPLGSALIPCLLIFAWAAATVVLIACKS